MSSKLVAGESVRVGDVIAFLGRLYPVERFDALPGLNVGGQHRPARIAVSGTWSMTVFDDDALAVLRPE
jgi:hypothetical protein